MSSCSNATCCCGGHQADETGDVQQALNNWLLAVSSGSPDPVLTLYLDEAVLLPTLSPVLSDTQAKRRDYFKVFTANQNLRGKIDEIRTRVYGDIAINSGHYTFSFTKDGKDVSAPARFTFVYKRTPQGWMIVEHHSSLLPAGH